MIIAYEKTLLCWYCPKCNHYHEIEESEGREIGNKLECDNCDFVDEYELR